MKETPIFSASNSFITNVNRNNTLKENISVQHFGDLVVETGDLTGITTKEQMASWVADHLKITVTPELPPTVEVEVSGTTQTLSYVKGSISPTLSHVDTTIDTETDALIVDIDINFTYTLMVYHSSTQGVDIAVPEVTVPFSVFGVLTE